MSDICFGVDIGGTTVKIGYFSQMSEELQGSERVIDYIKDIAEYIETPDGKISATKMLEKFLFTSELIYSPVCKLSGGEQRRLHLLRVLMSAPNVLILDEPSNDLDIKTLAILEDYLDEFSGVVITVSHDRYFLDRICNKIFAYEGEEFISNDDSVNWAKGIFFKAVTCPEECTKAKDDE